MNDKRPRRYAKSYESSSRDSILGRNLKTLMNEKGINQNQLADDLGVTKGTVSTWMTATSIQSYHLDALAKYFGTTMDFLMGKTRCSSNDVDMRAICDKTGLSETAANNLIALNEAANGFNLSGEDWFAIREPQTYRSLAYETSALFSTNSVLENMELLRLVFEYFSVRKHAFGMLDDMAANAILVQIMKELGKMREEINPIILDEVDKGIEKYEQ